MGFLGNLFAILAVICIILIIFPILQIIYPRIMHHFSLDEEKKETRNDKENF